MMFAFQPLLAADWIQILIFLFIVGSSLIGQLFKVAQQRRKDGRGRPQPKLPPAPGQPPGAPAAGRPEKSLEREIEAFLRKTLGGGEPAQPKPAQPKPAKRPAQRPARRPPPGQRPAPPIPRPQATDDFPSQETVGQHVRRHIEDGGVGQRDAHLAEQLGQADERMESHLHDIFDHRLGTLKDEEKRLAAEIGEGTDAEIWSRHQKASPLAAQLYQMLSTPQQVQAAIVLAEILRRPEDPWS